MPRSPSSHRILAPGLVWAFFAFAGCVELGAFTPSADADASHDIGVSDLPPQASPDTLRDLAAPDSSPTPDPDASGDANGSAADAVSDEGAPPEPVPDVPQLQDEGLAPEAEEDVGTAPDPGPDGTSDASDVATDIGPDLGALEVIGSGDASFLCEDACVEPGVKECVGAGLRECVASGVPGCSVWTPVEPCDDGDVCTLDGCHAGSCTATSVAGTACDDGDACTQDDVCQPSGACEGEPKPCDDAKPCTIDSCNSGSGQCHHDTSGCDCTSAAECDDEDPCTLDVCDDAGGTCISTATPGEACDDGDPCSEGDACQSDGACVGAPLDCDDGEVCTDDACDGGVCVHVDNDDPCDDGSACTSADACSGGICAGTPDCDDGDVCTDDGCDPAIGCTYTHNTAPCDDGNACTEQDACSGGVCVGGDAVECTPAGVCFEETVCDPAKGTCPVVPKGFGASCDDADLCTDGDVCNGIGECVGAPKVCSDGDQCTQDSCDPTTGECGFPLEPNGAPCVSALPCSAGTACSVGICGCDCADPDAVLTLELDGGILIDPFVGVVSIVEEEPSPIWGPIVYGPLFCPADWYPEGQWLPGVYAAVGQDWEWQRPCTGDDSLWQLYQLGGGNLWNSLYQGAAKQAVLTLKGAEPDSVTFPEMYVVDMQAPGQCQDFETVRLGMAKSIEKRLELEIQGIPEMFRLGKFRVTNELGTSPFMETKDDFEDEYFGPVDDPSATIEIVNPCGDEGTRHYFGGQALAAWLVANEGGTAYTTGIIRFKDLHGAVLVALTFTNPTPATYYPGYEDCSSEEIIVLEVQSLNVM